MGFSLKDLFNPKRLLNPLPDIYDYKSGAFDFILDPGKESREQAEKLANEERAREEARQAEITLGQSAIEDRFSQFDDDYYSGIADKYKDYATPQLQEQYNESLRRLKANLARGGRLGSSVAAQEESRLGRSFSDELLNIASQGRQYANEHRGAISSAYNSLLSQNQGLADSAVASDSAQREASRLSVIPEFEPIGQALALASEFAVKRNAAETQRRLYNTRSPYSTYGIDKRPEETIYGG